MHTSVCLSMCTGVYVQVYVLGKGAQRWGGEGEGGTSKRTHMPAHACTYHQVCGGFNYIEFMSNSKSGSFFFYSHDGE